MEEKVDCLEYLSKEHGMIRAVSKILQEISRRISDGGRVEAGDVGKMMTVLEGIEKCHRIEEDQVLFQLKARSRSFEEPIKELLAEHDKAREIFKEMRAGLERWKVGGGADAALSSRVSEYAASLAEHVRKEEIVFRNDDVRLLSPADHKDLVERFKKVEQNILGPVSKGQMAATVIELQNRLCG